jgi:choline kinase
MQSFRLDGKVRQRVIKKISFEEANDPNFIDSFLKKNPSFEFTGIKAIIPAAGKSIRLFPHSQDLPKGLIPVGKKPILRHIIESLNNFGINEIIFITGFQDIKVRKYFRSEVKYIFNPFFGISNILASIWMAKNELEGTAIILYSDLLFEKDIIDRLIQDENDFSIAISPTNLDVEAEKVILNGNFVREIGKDIPYDSKGYEFVGIAKFSKKGVHYLKETLEEMAHEEGFLGFYFTDVIQRLIYKDLKISTQIISPELWVDIDFPRDLQRAENKVLPLLFS